MAATNLTSLSPVVSTILSGALAAATTAEPLIGLVAPLINDGVSALMQYASGTVDPATAQANFAAACTRFDAASAQWKAAELANPAKDAPKS
jgi:hypothetical protein